MNMARADIEIADEISTDVKDIYNELITANKLLREIYVELRSLRRLAEKRLTKSAEMKSSKSTRKHNSKTS